MNNDLELAEKKVQKKKAAHQSVIEKPTILKEKAVNRKNASAKKIIHSTEKTNKSKTNIISVTFQLRFSTQYGQNLYVTGSHPLLGNNILENALPLQYFNADFWYATLEMPALQKDDTPIVYNYVLKDAEGLYTMDFGKDKQISPADCKTKELLVIDGWNHAGYLENSFYTVPFKNVLFKRTIDKKIKTSQNYTHRFRVKSPFLKENEAICILGSAKSLGNWDTEAFVLLEPEENNIGYSAAVNLSKEAFPIAYKYGVVDKLTKKFLRFEEGNNRIIYDTIAKNKKTNINDAFAALPFNSWKGAGVAIPVFSLKTANSFGVGEFNDIKLLVDWSKQVGLKLIQLLPINDTTATHTWIDSYPYSAISAFALHPMFLNLATIADKPNAAALKKIEAERLRLNSLDVVDYELVTKYKIEFVAKLFATQKKKTFASTGFKTFFLQNKHWLIPYAAFCYLRDAYNTANFNEWPAYKKFNAGEIEKLAGNYESCDDNIALHYYIQYQLHLQLKEATEYAHANGIVVKGDIPIGIYRYSADAWQSPELYHMDQQAGAPPDDFAVKGQNWGFPTYNWQKMKEDGFAWWKQRFEQMGHYFDAFRIDHILGFFRIWSIPMDAVEGILGKFVPAIPLHVNEFNSQRIWFDYNRYTKPFITESVLWEEFGYDNEEVKKDFLEEDGYGTYKLKEAFSTQRKVAAYFADKTHLPNAAKLKQGLFNLISNVILFEEEGSNGHHFHFRFGMDQTSSFRNLDTHTAGQLKELYVNYFFRRQDDFWMKEAWKKLPALKEVTNMLICGEDLGMVPACVPDVMRNLGFLSLEIQRMPKDPKREFFHPNDAPYLSVVTPSTHDMSTIRGWWEEDREKTQRFFNTELGQWGDAPYYCESWINKAIVVQHLYSPAMWSIFQLQDLLGMDDRLRREDPADERINVPANPTHYWQYRMHISLEQLLNEEQFNKELSNNISACGR